MDTVLEAVSLSKRYGPFTALHEVSFHLKQGEVVGFLGQNGAGKSTTMKILTGFVAPTGGRAVVAGHDLLADPLACRRAIGYLPEELPLYPDMTVEAFLDHVARLKGIERGKRRTEVVDAIQATHLTENAKRYIRKLSKGNKQRVGIAQALLGRPPLIILDEPTAGLDPSQVAYFRALVAELARGHTVLLSTHILAEVEAVCSRVVVVHRGRTVAAESIEELRKRTAMQRVQVRLRGADTAPALAALAASSWARAAVTGEGAEAALVIDCPSERRGELVALVEAHGGVRELVEVRRSLEEVFRDLTAGVT
jgi:ABC-2 type transport system ATP-binding protein